MKLKYIPRQILIGLLVIVIVPQTSCTSLRPPSQSPKTEVSEVTSPPSDNPWQKVKLLRSFPGHLRRIRVIAINPDNRTFASTSVSGKIKLWSLKSGKEIRSVYRRNSIDSLTFSPDGKFIAAGDYQGNIKLVELSTDKAISIPAAHRFPVWSLAFSPDGSTLASGSWDATIKIWETSTGKLLRTISEKDAVLSIIFSPDGKALASGNFDGSLNLWQPDTGKRIRSFRGHLLQPAYRVAITPDGQLLVSGSGDKTVKLWKLQTGKLLHSLRNHSDAVIAIAMSPDGQTLSWMMFQGVGSAGLRGL